MQLIDLPLDRIVAAPWNPREMNEAMRGRLRHSVQRFGLVAPLVVRPLGDGQYETVGGAQRLAVLRELGSVTVPCVVVATDDAEARLLSQALNHITGSDNLGLRAEVLRHILEALPMDEVLGLLPDSAQGLQALAGMGQESIAQALGRWEQAQHARLRHLAFQLTDAQLAVVEQALERLLSLASQQSGNPNKRGVALYLLCLGFLERETRVEEPTPQEEGL